MARYIDAENWSYDGTTTKARYIDENKAFEVLSDYYHQKTLVQRASLKEALSRVPTADVRENVHAKNVAKDYADCDQFVCSNCGIELQDWVRVERDEDDGDITYSEYVFKFCPNCGAKMRKRRDNG